jgi:hypothetical protein
MAPTPSRPLPPAVLHAIAIASLGLAVLAGLVSWTIGTSTPPRPTNAIDATVEGDTTVPVPVGAPAVVAWLDAGVLVPGPGGRPRAQAAWSGVVGASPVRLRAGDQLIELEPPGVDQLRGYTYETRQARTFAELGLHEIAAQPGPEGVYVNQVALRPGDLVAVEGPEPSRLWRGGRAAIDARAADIAATDQALSALMAMMAAVCALIGAALGPGRWLRRRR